MDDHPHIDKENLQSNANPHPSVLDISAPLVSASDHADAQAGAIPHHILHSAPTFAHAATPTSPPAHPLNAHLSQQDLDLIVATFHPASPAPRSSRNSAPNSASAALASPSPGACASSSPRQLSSVSRDLDGPHSPAKDATFDEREVEAFLSPCAQRGNRKSDVPPIGKRIAIERMRPVDNPLEKDGRNTVIRGRLHDDNLYAKAAGCLGLKLFCFMHKGPVDAADEDVARSNHLKDIFSFGILTRGKKMKVPVIGGDHLNVFRLQREVLLLGGVKNVVENRAFRIVAQQLELPGSCTSAAYVLKGTYERYLYHYEQLIVFGRWPKKPNEVVNMKTIVNEGREIQARAKAKHKNALARKRKSSEYQSVSERMVAFQQVTSRSDRDTTPGPALDQHENPPPCGVTRSNAETLKKFMAISSAFPIKTWNLYCELTAEEGLDISLPQWAANFPLDGALDQLVSRAMHLETENRVTLKSDIILLAVAECFRHSENSLGDFVGLGLARLICCFSSKVKNGRASQGLLFVLMTNILRHLPPIDLAMNNSGMGLLDGLFAIVHNQCHTYKHATGKSSVQDGVEDSPQQDEAACFCAMQVLLGLSREKTNCNLIVEHKFFFSVCDSLLRFDCVPRFCVSITLTVMWRCRHRLWNLAKSNMIQILVELLVGRLQQATIFDGKTPFPESDIPAGLPDFDVSSVVLKLLASYSSTSPVSGPVIMDVVTSVAKLLHSLHRIDDVQSLTELSCVLVDNFPDIVARAPNFVIGLFELLRYEEHRGKVITSVQHLHFSYPLTDHCAALESMCAGSSDRCHTDTVNDIGEGQTDDGHVVNGGTIDAGSDETGREEGSEEKGEKTADEGANKTAARPLDFEDVLAVLEDKPESK